MLILLNAAELPKWDATTLLAVVAELKTTAPDVEVEWGLDAGEGWLWIQREREVIAKVRAPTTVSHETRFAFVNAHHPFARTLRELLSRHDVSVVDVSDFDEVTFSIRGEDFSAFGGPAGLPIEAFDPDNFAADDLVFVTE